MGRNDPPWGRIVAEIRPILAECARVNLSNVLDDALGYVPFGLECLHGAPCFLDQVLEPCALGEHVIVHGLLLWHGPGPSETPRGPSRRLRRLLGQTALATRFPARQLECARSRVKRRRGG